MGNEDDVSLSVGFKAIGDSVHYEYDFGSSWPVDIDVINVETQKVKKADFVPCIKVVGGRGKTIPEYAGPDGGGTKYNRKELNKQIADLQEFVYYPYKVNKNDDDQDDDQDDDLQVDTNTNNKNKTSVLGKRRATDKNQGNHNKKQRKK